MNTTMPPPPPTIKYLDRSEVIWLISPRSKNEADLDIKFATRIQEALIAKFKNANKPPKVAVDEPDILDNAAWLRWYRIANECGINSALDAYQTRYKQLTRN